MRKKIFTIFILTVISCKKVFEVEPKSQVDQTQAYRNVYDADAAVIGEVTTGRGVSVY